MLCVLHSPALSAAGFPIGDPGARKLSITTIWINLYGTLGHVAASDEWSYLSVESRDSEPENELILYIVFVWNCIIVYFGNGSAPLLYYLELSLTHKMKTS